MAPPSDTTLVWFRRDLRLADNPAWSAAIGHGRPIVALFVADPVPLGASSLLRTSVLRANLASLDASLRALGGALRVEHGDPTEVVPRIIRDVDARRLVCNADVSPYSRERDARVDAAGGLVADRHWGSFVHAPGTVLAGTGRVSRVFTPFHRTWSATEWASWPDPTGAVPVVLGDAGAGLDNGALGAALAAGDGTTGRGTDPYEAGERGARGRLDEFDLRVDDYLATRDIPSLDATSGLSIDLHFGTVSPRRVAQHIGTSTADRAAFVRQLAWRDWYAHLLSEMPHLVSGALDPDVGEIDWIDDPIEFDAWCRGTTGFPIVDAGMRELAGTGRMHNRVRMITASFLVKDLLVDWRWGERWFRRHLLDADVSQNVGNWQWAAGTGPDSAPFFRVFNPVVQSRRFDPDGTYIRHWVPELAGLPGREIHQPATLGPIELAAAGVTLGDTYPEPIVDHSWARERALVAYRRAREAHR